MNTWAVQGSKARFSELLDACSSEGPQVVSRRGIEAAGLIPINEWRRLQSSARPSLRSLLLSDAGRVDLLLPESGLARRRLPVSL